MILSIAHNLVPPPPFPIYLDFAATTPVDPRVAAAMIPYLTEKFGNQSSAHLYGKVAEEAVENARFQVASLVNADPREIVWTSGATESNNLALKGAARFSLHDGYPNKGRHIVTVKTEHKAVLDVVGELERQGFTATYLTPQTNGLLDLNAFEAALRPDTLLASVMLVNNEIGVIQDIVALGEICHARGILLHVDAAQATGKVAIDLSQMPVDLMSFSAHKTYGPKGIGALYVRRKPRVRLEAQMHGGGQERGMRSGTLATHQIVGMGAAFHLAQTEMHTELARIKMLRDRLWQGLSGINSSGIKNIILNGDMTQRIPHNLNISFERVEGDQLTNALTEIAVSSGSACTAASLEPSYVLRALGRSDALARSTIRFSLGRTTTLAEIDFTINLVKGKINQLRCNSDGIPSQ